MKNKIRKASVSISVFTLFIVSNIFVVPSAFASPDVEHLQTCLKEENSSLDVLVLMDSSRSLRKEDPKIDESGYVNKSGASDPDQIRGPLLKSSLKLLFELANDSNHSFRVNLKNFGDNSRDIGNLKKNWVDWKELNTANANTELDEFINRALYDDSHGTEWGSGLATAKDAFNSRINDGIDKEQKSCPVMIWITDGAPTDRVGGSSQNICQPNYQYSLDWFRSNNILVLGGLLNPQGDQQARQFGPIVDGSQCAEIPENWTQGTVIEATDANSLAWQFIALVAGIKNLIDLSVENGKFFVDKGTSRIEVFIRGTDVQWKILDAKGKEVCSSTKRDPQCDVKRDKDIGITTIGISPSDPKNVEGIWTVISPGTSDSVQVYGGISVDAKASRLVVDPPTQEVSEGKEARFNVSLVNADSTPFDMSGFKSIVICAQLDSTQERSCKTGATSVELTLHPTTQDSTVPITATVTSAKGKDRQYNVSAVVKVVVSPSGLLPTLVCAGGKEGEPCEAENVKNKSSKSKNILEVIAPTQTGAVSGQIYLKDFKIVRDDISTRGDGNFEFKLLNQNGDDVSWGNRSALFSPGDKLSLEISTAKSGESEIVGTIRYIAVINGEEIPRQLTLNFEVGNASNPWAKLIFVLLAYLLTVGIPYLYLLTSARKRAVLNPPFGEFSFLAIPFTTTSDWKIVRSGTSADGGTQEISHREFVKVELAEGSTSVQVENATIEIVPPKWNPFAQTTTSVSLPGNLVFTTSHDDGIREDNYKFAPSLIGEAIVYFSPAANLDPVTKSTFNANTKPESNDLWGSDSGFSTTEEMAIAEGPINGRIILISQTDGNRKKAVQDIIGRLGASAKSLELETKILEMRKQRFEASQVVGQTGPTSPTGTEENSSTDSETEKDPTTETGTTGLWEDPKPNTTNLWSDDDGSSGSNNRGLWN
jgi:hypothetical protein